MSVAVIINPISGGARPGQAAARAEAAAVAIGRVGEAPLISVTERAGHARELTEVACRQGVRLVIAWGGDGTVNEVSSALAFGPTPLGIVPAGSGNGLARELGIPSDPIAALQVAMASTPRPIDVGRLNDRLFVNLAGFGIDAYVADSFNQPGNETRGLAGYVRLGCRGLAAYEPDEYTITIGDTTEVVRAVILTLANSAQFGNNARIAPGARVDDGVMELVSIEESARWRTLLQVPRLFLGTIDRAPGYCSRQVTEAVIVGRRRLVAHVDGEPMDAGMRATVRVHPGVLKLAVS